ncbi:hypothetical protein QFC24_001566 [Naganishia onofrii]|uniref:Uncharacterized protein n=1 Tax=Naganishia onofrii TaxID=1851511 RepID=A0ACC2XRP9_9TREE|nr:hypothetical protein QFC24_001566 [Naganishia onofrii]
MSTTPPISKPICTGCIRTCRECKPWDPAEKEANVKLYKNRKTRARKRLRAEEAFVEDLLPLSPDISDGEIAINEVVPTAESSPPPPLIGENGEATLDESPPPPPLDGRDDDSMSDCPMSPLLLAQFDNSPPDTTEFFAPVLLETTLQPTTCGRAPRPVRTPPQARARAGSRAPPPFETESVVASTVRRSKRVKEKHEEVDRRLVAERIEEGVRRRAEERERELELEVEKFGGERPLEGLEFYITGSVYRWQRLRDIFERTGAKARGDRRVWTRVDPVEEEE